MTMLRSHMPSRTGVFVAFGANLGEPAERYRHAVESVSRLPETHVVRQSALYRTKPVGVSGQPDYFNAVLELETGLAPRALLDKLLEIECEAGRTRESHHAPRTLDLDLLLYGDEVIHSPGLEVPHPRMHQRAFVLVPLAEIAPDVEIPGRGAVASLLPAVADQGVMRL